MKLKMLTALFLTAVIITSCNKEKEEPHRIFVDLPSFMEAKKPQSQFFTINAESGGTITGDAGTVITFPAKAFKNSDGMNISGNVQIELKEIFDNTSMIFSGVFPVSGGKILNSGGEYYINVMQSGEALLIKENKHYSLTLPAQAVDPGMIFYKGAELDGSINWTAVSSTIDSANVYDLFTYNSLDNSYSILTDSIGWCNCDAFPELPTLNVSIEISGVDGTDLTNTVAFAVLDDENAAFDFYQYAAVDENTVRIFSNSVPATKMHLVVVSVVNESLYFEILEIDPDADAEYEISLSAGTEAALDAAILALP
ncbi:MAG: hypothetical protein H7Y00_16105 [Fimbriimonadaceae bacterium]|nr:hypothetical protein [Chitinophagales bacterium]